MTLANIFHYEQLDAEFREYEASFQQNGEGSDFPAKTLTGIIEVCYAVNHYLI